MLSQGEVRAELVGVENCRDLQVKERQMSCKRPILLFWVRGFIQQQIPCFYQDVEIWGVLPELMGFPSWECLEMLGWEEF